MEKKNINSRKKLYVENPLLPDSPWISKQVYFLLTQRKPRFRSSSIFKLSHLFSTEEQHHLSAAEHTNRQEQQRENFQLVSNPLKLTLFDKTVIKRTFYIKKFEKQLKCFLHDSIKSNLVRSLFEAKNKPVCQVFIPNFKLSYIFNTLQVLVSSSNREEGQAQPVSRFHLFSKLRQSNYFEHLWPIIFFRSWQTAKVCLQIP